MPTKAADVRQFFERIAILEAQVADLMRWQKWQMVILAGILVAVVSKRF